MDSESVANSRSESRLSGDLRPAQVAPRPLTLEETGLTRHFLVGLFSKHLYEAGVLTRKQIIERLSLAGPIVEELIEFLRQEVLLEVHSKGFGDRELLYGLTDKGRDLALDTFAKSGYVGAAPVPLELYREVVAKQSIHGLTVTRTALADHMSGIVLSEELLQQLGPAMNSGRAIFIYGPAGTGKTYITQKMVRLFDDHCLVPAAIAIDEQVVSVFDPMIHHVVSASGQSAELMLERGHDPRFILCERPIVVTGGELGMDMLEVMHNQVTRTNQAPLQLKANNGIYIIDDMGRQRATPMEIFNRWIVPLEERRDFLTLSSGRHFETPFDQVLVFSSNINPLELADEAFLRRIGYKIYFGYLNASQYGAIWKQVCAEKQISFQPALLDYIVTELHGKREVEMRPCHPRDLLGMALDRCAYLGLEQELEPAHLEWAWDNYFVSQFAQTEMTAMKHNSGGADHG